METTQVFKPLDLTRVPDHEILCRMERLAKTERKITHIVLFHINEVETRKLYLVLGFNSLYKYLTQHLGYSEDSAYDRMQASRVLRNHPQIAEKLEDGALKLSQLVKVEQSLKQERKTGKPISQEITEGILEKLENKTVFETQKILACELNQTPIATQKLKPQKDDSIRLELTLTKEQYEIIQKAQSLISHSVPDNNLADGFTFMAKSLIQKTEGKVTPAKVSDTPLKNPEEVKRSSENKNCMHQNPTADTSPLKESPKNHQSSAMKKNPKSSTQSFRLNRLKKRKHISLKVRREVFSKANHCCEHINLVTKQRCQSRYQLQLDHIHPIAKGGSNDITNLRVLCGVHNRQEALRWGLSWTS